MSIFSLLNEMFLKMTWLNETSKYIVEVIFRLNTNELLGSSLQFFIYDIIKIFLLLSVLIFFVSYIQSYFPPERTKKILTKFKGVKGNIMGALLGTITPFCSCSSIPIFIGFTSAGLSLGIMFSFLIASPLVNPAALFILFSLFGFNTAILYILLGIILAVIGGVLIEKLGLEDQIMDYVKNVKNIDTNIIEMSSKERFRYAKEEVKKIVKKVWIFIFIGVGIGSFIHNVIPASVIEPILGSNNPFAVIIATIVGIPIYADIFGTIPIAEALFVKGVNIGTILSFMMAVTALSLPSMIMISKVVKQKLLTIFIIIVTVGIILIGYLFNLIQVYII